MKLIHIADLHLGKSIYDISLLEDQKDWINKFLSDMDNDKPEAVLIAGDVYDRSNPNPEAMKLLDFFLTELADRKIKVMMIAGNHDNGSRLEYMSSLLKKSGIHVAGITEKEIKKVSLNDEYGEIDFWLLPYTTPASVERAFDKENREFKSYEEAYKYLLENQEIDKSKRNVLIAHQNITKDGLEAERSGSETMVGGSGQIDYRVLDDFDYAALGHIHAPGYVGREEVRYCGTPLCYHFDELDRVKKDENGIPLKGYLKVEIKEKGNISIESKYIKPLHIMKKVEGNYEELFKEETERKGSSEYVDVLIHDKRATAEVQAAFENLYRNKGSKKIHLGSDYRENNGISANTNLKKMSGDESMDELFKAFYAEGNNGAEPEDKDMEVLNKVSETVEEIEREGLNIRDLKKIDDKSIEKIKKIEDLVMKQEEE